MEAPGIDPGTSRMLSERSTGGEAYLLTVKFPYSQVPHLLQFQIRLQYLLPNIDSGYNISYHFITSPFTFPTKLKVRCHISYIKIAPTLYSYWLSWPNLT